MICRVFIHPDMSVAVLHPNAGIRFEHEEDTVFLDRLSSLTPLSGLPFIDVDSADLPPRATRSAWRVQDNHVVAKEL